MDKQCSVCEDVKDIESFSWKIKKQGLRQHHCKKCQRDYNSGHYSDNKKKYIGKAMERSQNNKLFVYELKDNKPCADCKVVHRHFALDYDHRDPKTKVAGVAQLVTWSKEAILREVAKCDLVCATCHRYRTFKRFGRSTD